MNRTSTELFSSRPWFRSETGRLVLMLVSRAFMQAARKSQQPTMNARRSNTLDTDSVRRVQRRLCGGELWISGTWVFDGGIGDLRGQIPMGPSTPVQAGAFVVKARETNGRAAASSVDTNTAGLAIGKIGSADRAHHNTTFSHGRSEPNKRLERARAGHSGLSADGAWAKATAALGMTLLAHDTEEADTTGDRAAQLGLAQGPALAKDLCATQAGKPHAPHGLSSPVVVSA